MAWSSTKEFVKEHWVAILITIIVIIIVVVIMVILFCIFGPAASAAPLLVFGPLTEAVAASIDVGSVPV
jgi:hypothetical protein